MSGSSHDPFELIRARGNLMLAPDQHENNREVEEISRDAGREAGP